METGPGATPVIIPEDEPMVATPPPAGPTLVHVPPGVALPSVAVVPWHTPVAGPEIRPGEVLTVMVLLMPVNKPEAVPMVTLVLLLLQVPPLTGGSVKGVVKPTHMEVAPKTGDAAGFTVKIVVLTQPIGEV